MHSDIFHSTIVEGPESQKPSASMYNPAQQSMVYKKVQAVVEIPQRPPDMLLPSPLEMKLTETYGHDVKVARPVRDDAEAPGSSAHDFAGRPLVRPTEAPAMATSIPHEFWATGSKLQWMDTRGELCGRRQAWAGPPAERKHQEMSSTVMGAGPTNLPRPARQDRSPDIRATELDEPFRQDSCFTRDRRHTEDASATERFQRNLASNGVQRDGAAAENKAQPARRPATSSQLRKADDGAETRRRTDRNFSDLFENGGVSQRSPEGPSIKAADVEEPAGAVIQSESRKSCERPEEVRGRYARSARSQTSLGYNDAVQMRGSAAAGGWNMSSDSRRSTRLGSQQDELTAQGRKRVDMSSTAFLSGMGIGGEPPRVTSLSERSKGDVCRSPSADCTFRGGPPLSARDRYRASMQTNLFS